MTNDPLTSGHEHLVLGVLGGIASGKSAVARLLAGPDGVVVSADAIAHDVLASPEVTALVREEFGVAALDADGRPDRAVLAGRVFADAAARECLEGWIHPRVRARILARLEDARTEGRPRVVLDVPLLLENDAQHQLAGLCDHLVFVEVPAEERDRRAVHDRGWAPGEVARREAAQLDLDAKRARADVVIENRGTLQELSAAVDAALRTLGPAKPTAPPPPHSD